MNFSDVMREEAKWGKTENGADAKNTTDSALLDMFALLGAMRNRPDEDIIKKFELAYQEDPLRATRCMWYMRDIRGGLGERRIFRVLLTYAAKNHPEAVINNIKFIGEYGRWDDIYALINTPLEDRMWDVLRRQFHEDCVAMYDGKPCSLLAKWLKSSNSTNRKTKALGYYTAEKLGIGDPVYRSMLSKLRKHIDVVEVKMSAQQWTKINYPSVPSRAMMRYRNAFSRHDEERFGNYMQQVQAGDAKINASVLYPYNIVEKILHGQDEEDAVLEAQWKALPDYVGKDVNAIVMADVSGSMWGRPMATSIGLALYFAERNHGPYHNLFMTFSGQPEFVEVKGTTLAQKIGFIEKANWDMNTDLEKALLKILDVAKENHCTQDEMPKSLIIISDMEIDGCTRQAHRESFYDYVSRVYAEAGYVIPNVVFWNVESRHDVFLADKKRKGVQLVSGQSASTFKNLIGAIDKTAMELMYEVLDAPRYEPITLATMQGLRWAV